MLLGRLNSIKKCFKIYVEEKNGYVKKTACQVVKKLKRISSEQDTKIDSEDLEKTLENKTTIVNSFAADVDVP